MGYKFTTGSVRRGDVYFEDDRAGEPTYIDFGQDTITLRPSGSQILHVTADTVGIGTTSPDEMLTINGVESNSDETFIHFQEGGSDRAKVGINTSNNLIFHNQFKKLFAFEVAVNLTLSLGKIGKGSIVFGFLPILALVW